MQFSVRDVARMLAVSEGQVQRWIQEDRLPAERVGGRYCINRSELLEWATERRLDIYAIAGNAPNTPTIDATLADALRLGGVCHNIAGGDKSSALRAVVERIELPESFDRESLVQLFLARESVGSTAVGDGMALPHPRHPILLPVGRPLLTICYLQQPIDYGASDNRPVDTLFVLVCPTMASHMHLLAKLAGALRDPGFQADIQRKGTIEVVLAEAERLQRIAPIGSNGAEGQTHGRG